MFGYVRPLQGELKVRELEEYKAAYCGLCRTIGERHGFIARMFLSYDIVFLAMLLIPDSGTGCTCRCPARLLRKRNCCARSPGLDAAADAGTILSYWKIVDTARDGGPFQRGAARVLMMLLRRGYRKAAAARPEFDQAVSRCMDELWELERMRSPSLDRTADTFARILTASAPARGNETQARVMHELLYHLGRWIYLLDAWDDLAEDIAHGNYNPIRYRFPEGALEQRDYIRTTLIHSRNLACSALALLEVGDYRPIVENIVYLGLPAVEEAVFSGRWKKEKRRTRA